MARRATIVKQERERGLPLLLLDAGDSLAGDVDPAEKTQGATSVAVMNLLGYDAMALGPRDLALGLPVLRQRMAEAQFVVLSANAVEVATGKLVTAPYVMRRFGGWDGMNMAIIGLSGGPGTEEIGILDPVEATQAVVPQVAAQTKVIILLSHAGLAVDQRIAEAIPEIDLIVSSAPPVPGTSERETAFDTPWQAAATGTLAVQADDPSPGHTGRRLGVARLGFDANGHVVEHEWQRLLLGPEIADDAAIAEWVQQARTQ